MASASAMSVAEVEIFLLSKAMKGGKSGLSEQDKDFLKVLKGLGLKELSAEMVDALQSGNYEQVIRLGKSVILHQTANFTLASMGISNGPLSKLLGDALEAVTSTPVNLDKLREVAAKSKTEDPELSKAITDFLDGRLESITILVARRAGADPKLVSIAEGALKKDVQSTIQATGSYLGLSKQQMGLAVAAYNSFNNKEISKDTIETLIQYTEKYAPEWKSSRKDIQVAYTVAVNIVNIVEIMSKNYEGPIPLSLARVRDAVKSKQDFETAKLTGGIASALAAFTVILTAVSPLAGAISAVVSVLGTLLAGEFHKLGDRQGRESTSEWQQKAEDWAKKLVEMGTVPPRFRFDRTDSSMRMYLFMYSVSDYLHQNSSDRDFSNSCPSQYNAMRSRCHQSAQKFVVMYQQVKHLPPVANLFKKMASLGLGGPFTQDDVFSQTTLFFVCQVVASYYSIPVEATLLAISDLLQKTPVKVERDKDYSTKFGPFERNLPGYNSASCFVWDFTASGEPEVMFWDTIVFKRSAEYRKLMEEMIRCPDFGNRHIDVYDIIKNGKPFEIWSGDDLIKEPNPEPRILFEFEKGFSPKENHDNDWLRYYAEEQVLLWGLFIGNVIVCADAYKQVQYKDQTEFGSKQQIQSQLALALDQDLTLSYEGAVRKTIQNSDIKTVKALAKVGISPIDEPLVARSIRNFLHKNPKATARQAITQMALSIGVTPPIKKQEADLWYAKRITSYIALKQSTPKNSQNKTTSPSKKS
jgi:hypothetical protein